MVEDECPDCGGQLVLRTNRHTQQQFVGCKEWPKCSWTERDPDWEPCPDAYNEDGDDDWHPGHPSNYGDN